MFNLLFLPVLLDRVGYGGRSQSLKLLTKVIHIHRTDSTYDSVNFDDPISNLAYFKKLCTSFLQASDEEIDQFLKSFMRQIKMKTMEDSTESAEAQALHIMRSAAEAIHGAFQEINPDSFIESATFVIRVMVDALQHILDMTPDRDSDDVVSSRYSLKLMGDENDEVSNDYEGLGWQERCERLLYVYIICIWPLEDIG